MSVKLIKLSHCLNREDEVLVSAIENHYLQLAEFSHAIHVKLAYSYLARFEFNSALKRMQKTLLDFLQHHGVCHNKFHHTLTKAWLNLIWKYMQESPGMKSANAFISNHSTLLNKDLLLFYYSHDLLFSDRARTQYVEPDLQAFNH